MSHAVSHHLVGRLIQITLTLYLLPAFLVVLVVGGVGMVVLKIDRVLTDLFERMSGPRPRTSDPSISDILIDRRHSASPLSRRAVYRYGKRSPKRGTMIELLGLTRASRTKLDTDRDA